MKEFWKSPYRKFFLIGLLCHVVASWFSIGYHQIDEHFMILEFANFKFGTVPASVIPWEFTHQIRPTLQPSFAYFVFQIFKTIGIDDPFFQVFILRLFSGVAGFIISCKIALRLAPNLEHPTPRSWWIIAVACLWFMPYLQVRFSSENFAGIAFLSALLIIPDIFRKGMITASAKQWALSGLLLGIAFYLRFQMAFAILGLLAWLLLYARPVWKSYLFIGIGTLAAIGLNLVIDRWFYGQWVFTPYNYFTANITDNVAATYGTTPWYDYILLFATQGIPPLSWVFLVLFFIGLSKKPMQIMVFVFLPFLLGHMAVAHKEFRFLYPVVLPFLFICFSGLDSIWQSIAHKKWLMPSFKFLVWVNIILLSYRCFFPAKTTHAYYKFLHQYANGKPLHLVTLGRGIYDEGFNEIYLYRPDGFTEDTMSATLLKSYLLTNKPDSILIMSYQATLPISDTSYDQQRLYTYLPDWVMNIQLNDWQARSDIWSVWLLRKKS